MRVFLTKIIKLKDFWTYFFVSLTYIILGFRFFSFIWNNTVNILYWDQWDIVDDITQKKIFNFFLKQHNEHRLGIGLIIIKILALLTHWNNKAETLFIGIILFLSAVIAFFLKRKITKKIDTTDIIIPFIFLNLYQWENLIWGFQIAFVLPLLFLIASLYVMIFKKNIIKDILLLIISLLAVYSSFHGLFVGIIILLYFLINFFKNVNYKKINIIF